MVAWANGAVADGAVAGLSLPRHYVYGVPWILGAKKGLPNFNQFYMVNAAQVVRKLQVVRPNLIPSSSHPTRRRL